ncbi:MAG: C40 family peptidase [Burkholderiaceae bacterium]
MPGSADASSTQTPVPTIRPGRRQACAALLGALLAGCGSTPRPGPTVEPHLRAGPVPPSRASHGDEVALRAVSMIGKPYIWGGTDPDEGCDCSGLAQFVYREAIGVDLPRTAAQMGRIGRSVSRRRLVPGDLVFFNTQRRRNSHVGIYVGEGRFVHAPSKGKSIRISTVDNPYWSRRFEGGRRPSI